MGSQRPGAMAAPLVLVRCLAATVRLTVALARRYPYSATFLLVLWLIATGGRGW